MQASPVSGARIAIIDYGIGNLRSAEKALQRAGADAFLSTDPHEISHADGVMLPGVGAFASCINALNASGLRSVTRDAIESGRPFLGVCIGMQMLHAGSEENGGVEGLGVFQATVRKLHPEPPDQYKVPHMQWNRLNAIEGRNSMLMNMTDADIWVYFVHSYAPEFHDGVVATCTYGQEVSAIVERDNVFGTQFHPEKSSGTGIQLLGRFIARCAPQQATS